MSSPEEKIKEIFDAFSLNRLMTPKELPQGELEHLAKEFEENSDDVVAFYNNSSEEQLGIGLLLTRNSLVRRKRDGECLSLERFPWKKLYVLLGDSQARQEKIKLANGEVIPVSGDAEAFLNLLKIITPIICLGFDSIKLKSLYNYYHQERDAQERQKSDDGLMDDADKNDGANKGSEFVKGSGNSEEIPENSQTSKLPYWILGGSIALVVAFYLISSAMIQTEKAYLGLDNEDLCRAGIATVMNKYQRNVNYSGSIDDVHFYHYRRSDDGSLWRFKCEVVGRTIMWGTKNGPWRNRPSDPEVTWGKEGASAFRITEEGVRSRVFRSR